MRTSTAFLTICLLCFAPGLNAQAEQELALIFEDTTENGQLPGQMIALPEEGFLVAGSHESQGWLAKLNNCGEILWEKTYLYGSATTFHGLAALPSGEIILAGSCRDCEPGDTTLKALVVKTSGEGDALLNKKMGLFNFDATAFAVLTTEDGNIAVTGNQVWFGFLYPTDAFLTVLDGQLETVFFQSYDHFYYDTPKALAQLSDGGFALAGYSNVALFEPRQALLIKTSASGSLVWKNVSNLPASQFSGVQQTNDGQIAALGMVENGPFGGTDALLVACSTASGSYLATKFYGGSSNDAGLSLHRLEEGLLASGYWGTPSQPNWGRRDWIFRLGEDFGLEEEFFKDSYLFFHTLANVAPLSPDGKDFAYISRMHFFDAGSNLFLKRTMQGHQIQLSEAPQHNQLVARDLSDNKGRVVYQGDPGQYDELRLEVLRNDQLVQTLYDMTPQVPFLFEAEIPAELANYEFRLTGLKNGVEYPEAGACNVVAGDAYIIQGQSNALASIPYDPDDVIDHAYRHHRNTFVRNFGKKYENDTALVWHREMGDDNPFAGPVSGQWGLVMGEKIVKEQGIPVAILNGAIGGISIDSMLPNPLDHADQSKSYGRFLHRVNRSGLANDICGLLFFQGETNAAGGFWDSAESYFIKFQILDAAWEQDFPDIGRRYLFQIRPGAYWAGGSLNSCLQVAEGHRMIAESDPDWQIMSSTGMNHDGTHYHYQNGYRRAGEDVYRLIAMDIYGEPFANDVRPPTPDSAWFANADRTELAVRLRHAGDTYTWAPGWEADFRLEAQVETQVTGVQLQDDLLLLTLAESPHASFTGLSHTSHPEGSEAAVKNANGTGMLIFYNFPVAPFTDVSQTVETLEDVGSPVAYPNPSAGQFQVDWVSQEEKVFDAAAYDMQGRLVWTGTGLRLPFSIDATNWPSGKYMVRLVHEAGWSSVQLQKN
jgi:hypothetical protein